MNTKDNQEAERKAFEKVYPIPKYLRWDAVSESYKPISQKYTSANMVAYALDNRMIGWMARATLTTPKVNEEVASGEVDYDKEYQVTFDKRDLFDFVRGAIKEALTNDDNVHNQANLWSEASSLTIDCLSKLYENPQPPTPSPSNVLVEALRELTDVCVTQIGADYNDAIHKAYKKGIEALATYSASTDSDLPNEEVK